VFALVLVKCLVNGFEYITTTLVMTLVPFVYEAVRDGRRGRAIWPSFLAAGFGAGLAVLVSLGVLSVQIAAVKGSVGDGVRHVVYSFRKRTYATPQEFPPSFRASLAAPAAPVLRQYLQGNFVNLGSARPVAGGQPTRARGVSYRAVGLLFLAASLVVCLRRRRWLAADEWRGALALVVATWFSVLAPLSWIVLFKAHSYVHLHLNFIVWHMPFTIFGFAVCALAIRSASRGRPRMPRQVASGLA
jgi:hypothetical protein